MYEGDEINSGDGGSFDRPGAIVSSSPDEQQNAAPVKAPKLPKAPKPSKVEEPAPMFFQDPTPMPVAPVRERTRSKLPLFIGIGVALVAIVVIVTVIIINANRGGDGTGSKIAGEVNLAGLFDPTAPVPFRGGSKISNYGYIDPTTEKYVIAREFTEAGPFYGGYAKARRNERDIVINRKGKVIATAPREYDQATYDIDENVWTVGSDVYDGEMKKVNPKNSTASYLGQGYAFIIPEKPDENSEWQTGIPYVVRVDGGETVFTCETINCNVYMSGGRTDSNAYAIVTEDTKGTKVISLSDGKVLFNCGNENKLAKLSDGIYIEKNRSTNKTVKYYVVDNNEAKVVNGLPDDSKAFSISKTDKYYKTSCGSGKDSKITDANGGEILPCSSREYWFLSKNTYKNIEKNSGKEAILFQGDDGAHLYDLKEKKDIKVYAGAGDVVVYENSAFIRITKGNGKRAICNVFELDKECVEINSNKELAVYPTFFTVGNKTYSYNLEVIEHDD